MALEVNQLCGFETGGLEEAASSGGSPAASNLFARSGVYSLSMPGATSNPVYTITAYEEGTVSGGTGKIFGFGVRFNDLGPTIQVDFAEAYNLGETAALRLRLATTGNLFRLVDANNSEVDTVANPFTVDTWHYIEVYFENVASGAANVFVDGTEVLTATATDFLSTSAWNVQNDGRVRLRGHGTATEDMWVDDLYVLSGATAKTDRLGIHAEVLGAYQNDTEDATDQGSTLSNGAWSDVGETPGTTAEADYVSSAAIGGYTICDEGNRAGPSGDAPGTIKAAKYIARLKRTNGSSPTTLDQSLGNSVDGVSHVNRAAALTTAYQNFFRLETAAGIMPTNSENFAHGMRQTGTGGRDIFAEELWACLLHVNTPSTTLADLTFPDQNYMLGPFGT
jgi:hypothetical protein